MQGTLEKSYGIGLSYSNTSFVSVQGDVGSSPTIKNSKVPKGGMYMTKKEFSLKINFFFIITIIFNLIANGSFLA